MVVSRYGQRSKRRLDLPTALTRSRLWRAALTLCLYTIHGCANDSGATARPTERDSAGIRIVESDWKPEQVPVWTLDSSPSLQIGEVEGDSAYLFHQVGAVWRLPDDRIALINGGSELRFYDSQGKHVRSTGQRGEGPGEFMSIAGAVFARDTFFIYDDNGATQRLSLFDDEGNYISSPPSLAWMRRYSKGSPSLMAVTADGRLVFRARGFPVPRRQEVGLFRQTVPNIVAARDGRQADTVGIAGMDFFTGDEQVMVPPYQRGSRSAAQGERLVMTHGASYEIESWSSPTGTLERLVRLRREPAPLPRAEFERAADARVESEARAQAGHGDAPVPGPLAKLRASLPAYPTKPAWNGLMIDAEERIWAREWAQANDTTPALWNVFDRNGLLIARAQTPVRLSIHQIGTDFILGVFRDADGVEFVRQYSIRR